MQPFKSHSGAAVPLLQDNIDTDQIIPKQFLKRIEREGYGQFLFYDWRFADDGTPKDDFVLNQPQYRDASVLIAGKNFGCGSSREHAAWALAEYGFRVIIASSFADIFQENAVQNGILPVVLRDHDVAQLADSALRSLPFRLTVDLGALTVIDSTGTQRTFSIDPSARKTLIEGLDQIGQTLLCEEQISAYETKL